MVIVEKARDVNNNAYTGPEKKRIALTLIKTVINDLALNNIIDPAIAKEINANVDFWGSVSNGSYYFGL
mgnify:CR=1 FL=1